MPNNTQRRDMGALGYKHIFQMSAFVTAMYWVYVGYFWFRKLPEDPETGESPEPMRPGLGALLVGLALVAVSYYFWTMWRHQERASRTLVLMITGMAAVAVTGYAGYMQFRPAPEVEVDSDADSDDDSNDESDKKKKKKDLVMVEMQRPGIVLWSVAAILWAGTLFFYQKDAPHPRFASQMGSAAEANTMARRKLERQMNEMKKAEATRQWRNRGRNSQQQRGGNPPPKQQRGGNPPPNQQRGSNPPPRQQALTREQYQMLPNEAKQALSMVAKNRRARQAAQRQATGMSRKQQKRASRRAQTN